MSWSHAGGPHHQSALRRWIDQPAGGPPTPAGVTCAPFMNQIPTLPLPSCKRMSLLPSPLKSPVPAIDQPAGAAPTPAGVTCAPFMNQIPTLPLVSRHSKSALPSPLKSRCPTIDQPAGPAPTPAGVTCTPFISHTPVLPLPSPNAISLLPSPLKSWASVSLLLAETPVAELHGRVVLEALLCVKTTAGNDSEGGTAE